ncbi:MAG: ComEA family DNA-binding protein [Symbiobacteriaceae bacterium]|nr:ComEA family DNA-binding protein [Symbiobacteriaceae bacterium]
MPQLHKEQVIFGLILGILISGIGITWWNSYQKSLNPVASLTAIPWNSTAASGTSDPGTAAVSGATTPEVRSIIVYIVGAVKSPGVYELPEGSRLDTAVRMAGGFDAEADREAVNLAMVLQDGSRYRLPRTGEEATETESDTAESIDTRSSAKININTASKATLETLPQIGGVRAQAIIDYRARNGPFLSIDDLKKVPGIGSGIFEQLRDLITV